MVTNLGVASAKVLNISGAGTGRALVAGILAGAGFDVVDAASGAEALRLALEQKPDAALVDARLPDLGGREVCRRLRAAPHGASIALILTSAAPVGSEERAAGLAAGADLYLPQPFEPRELIETVRAALRRTQGQTASRAAAQAEQRKTAFLAVLGHELRNPLASIMLAAQNLLRFESHTPSEQRSKQIILRQARALARLLDGLLDVSRIEGGKIELVRERIDLSALARQGVEAQVAVAEARGIGLILDAPAEAVPVLGDPVRLDQVLLELTSNAVKFSDQGQSVRVSLRVGDGRALLCVEDEGAGMDGDTLARAFLPFEQGANAAGRGGLGLGLALAHAVVELHGGAIAARSAGHGKGSTFEVSLPLAG